MRSADREIGLDSVRTVADTYHMNIEEADPAAAPGAAAPYIGHVQASDSNRLEPGAGHLDWPLFGATMRDDRLRRRHRAREPALRSCGRGRCRRCPPSCAGTCDGRRYCRYGTVRERPTGAAPFSPRTGTGSTPCRPPACIRTSGAGTRPSSPSGPGTCPPRARSRSSRAVRRPVGRRAASADRFRPHPDDDYSPGASFWRASGYPGRPRCRRAGLIQPPNHALGRAAGAPEPTPRSPGAARSSRRAYPRLVAWHEYLAAPPRPWWHRIGRRRAPVGVGHRQLAPLGRRARRRHGHPGGRCRRSAGRSTSPWPDLLHANPDERPTTADYRKLPLSRRQVPGPRL